MNKLSVDSSMAVLSEASYGYFSNVYSAGFYDQQAVIDAITDKSDRNNFSATQAAEFVSHWRVVDHQPETTSGFSATLFQRIGNDLDSGLKGDLIIADALSIVMRGKAGQQIADMCRYFRHLNTWMNRLFTRHRTVGNFQPSFLEAAA